MAPTTHVIDGYGEAVTSETTLEPSATPIVAGQRVTLSGTVEPAANTGTVRVERRTSGSPHLEGPGRRLGAGGQG